MMAPKDNFSSNMEPGEETHGTVYFLMEGEAPFNVTFGNPESETTVDWEIGEVE